jgi:hypothetical protein
MSRGSIIIDAMGVLFALLQALSYLNRDYRILCDKFVHNSAFMAVLILAILGFLMGTALGCLFARRSFLETTGRSWLYVWRSTTVGGMRLRCIVALIVTGAVTCSMWYMALFEK